MANYYWRLGGFKIGSAWIPFSSLSTDPVIEAFLLGSGAGASPQFTGAAKVEPMISGTSPALKTILDITGANGGVVGAVEVYGIRMGVDGAPASGSVHRKWASTGGVMKIGSVGPTGEGGTVEASFEIGCNFDGTNDPWVMTDAVAAPTVTLVDEAFFMGPTVVNEVVYCSEQATFNGNGEFYRPICNGLLTAELVAVKPAAPTLSVTGFDGVLHLAAGAKGANVDGVVQYFRKASESGGFRVADATEEHISITMAEAHLLPNPIEGRWQGEVTYTVQFMARDDGTNANAVVDTTAAIVTSF
jgi:hypothetical protein